MMHLLVSPACAARAQLREFSLQKNGPVASHVNPQSLTVGSRVLGAKNFSRACTEEFLYFCLPVCSSAHLRRLATFFGHQGIRKKRALGVRHVDDGFQAGFQSRTPCPSHKPDPLDAALTFGHFPTPPCRTNQKSPARAVRILPVTHASGRPKQRT